MPRIDFKYKLAAADESKYGEGYTHFSLSKKKFESFDSSTLGLGDISQEGKYIQALAAFYDLEGFTAFCNQVDSHLVIPEFLKLFIDWLFTSLADEFKESVTNGRVILWNSLPFYTKFLGDGILFLWDTAAFSSDFPSIANIAYNLHAVSNQYQTEFLPDIKKCVSKPPAKLRCGVARGQIISIGEGNDYVGSCINIAARLQKLSQLTFAISRRGFDLSQAHHEVKLWKQFILKKVELRGIGEEELVYVKKKEFEQLPSKERMLFKNP
jgi:class 3 adenylate cyclase